MSNITAVWSDAISVIPATTIVPGTGWVRGTLDLRGKFGAVIYVMLGRKGATAPSSAIQVHIRRVPDNAAPGAGSPVSIFPLSSNTATGQATTVNADSAAGQRTLNVANTTGFSIGDSVCIYDAGFTRLEFARVSRVAAGILTLDNVLGFAHTAAQADNVTRQADLFSPTWLTPGTLWEVVVDYGAAASGSDYIALATAQTYDSDSQA